MTNNFAAIILAAGKGKRMKSELPKVLHRLHDKSLIGHILETIFKIPFDKIVIVVGYKGEMVIEELKDFDVEFVWQREQNGTGGAVLTTEKTFLDFNGTILVVHGDAPFLSAESIRKLHEVHTKSKAAATCLIAEFPNPSGYGRIVRQGETDLLSAIVEEKDATEKIKNIREINTGTFCFDSRELFWAIHRINNNNAQKEYYLPDSIKVLREAGKNCMVLKVADPMEGIGVNSVEELAALELANTGKNK
ncbi:MAG: NTP transferase domain-containing protein [candidate division Zixibacteria bacterium]|nr:NTP transferase domain-containing protein [candidate division Zixibacteria bacterium]